MSDTPPVMQNETGFDRVLAFTLPERDARGRCVRLGPTLDLILSAHDYPAAARNLLSEALVLCTLMGSLVKTGGQLTMQVQAPNGAVSLLACDYRGGELRGYLQHDEKALERLGANPGLKALFGDESFLAITFDLATGGRYQGVVPLDGTSLSEACELYFRQSEQVPSVLRVAISSEGSHTVAGGVLIQHLPDGEEGRERLHVRYDDPDWEHVSVIGGSIRHAELVDPALSMEAIVWRLYHEEDTVRVEALEHIVRGCRCTVEHYRSVLSQFAQDDLAEMREDDGLIHVDCAFCSKVFALDV